jgi:hypothetical protein
VTIKVHPDIVTKELRETEQNIIQDMWPWKRLKPDTSSHNYSLL